jgi:hypothetical protein
LTKFIIKFQKIGGWKGARELRRQKKPEEIKENWPEGKKRFKMRFSNILKLQNLLIRT